MRASGIRRFWDGPPATPPATLPLDPIRRARHLLAEFSDGRDDAGATAWDYAVAIRRGLGRRALVGFLIGLGVHPSAIPAVAAGAAMAAG